MCFIFQKINMQLIITNTDMEDGRAYALLKRCNIDDTHIHCLKSNITIVNTKYLIL
jgi:hypothetical protein